MAMTQKQKTLALLAVVASLAASLGSYAWFGVYLKGQTEEKAKAQADTLFSFSKDQVKGLAVTAKGETTTLERDGTGKDAGWKITSPIQGGADKLAVDALLDKIAGLKRKRSAGAQSDLGQFGLVKPRVQIAVTLTDGKKEELDLGDDNPFDGTVYLKKAGDPDVEIVEGGLKYPLEKGLFDLRDKRVFDFDEAQLQKLDAATPSLAFGLEKSGDDWKLVTPVQEKADAQKASQIATALKNLRATRFAAEQATEADLKRFGLDHPSYTVQLTLGKDLAEKTLILSTQKEGTAEHVYAKPTSQPWIAEVPTTILKDLDVSVMDLRDKTILSFKQADATALSFTTPKGTFQAQRVRHAQDGGFAADDWALTSPLKGPAKRWKLSSLLSTLETIKGSTIVAEQATAAELSKDGLDPPQKSVTVLGEGCKELGRLLVGKTEGSKTFVKSGANDRVFQVDAFRLSQLPTDASDLSEPAPVKDGGMTATAGH
ncbi:MAG: DUF4340 domain-containing protein [Deltaproteobacteria bacterium]